MMIGILLVGLAHAEPPTRGIQCDRAGSLSFLGILGDGAAPEGPVDIVEVDRGTVSARFRPTAELESRVSDRVDAHIESGILTLGPPLQRRADLGPGCWFWDGDLVAEVQDDGFIVRGPPAFIADWVGLEAGDLVQTASPAVPLPTGGAPATVHVFLTSVRPAVALGHVAFAQLQICRTWAPGVALTWDDDDVTSSVWCPTPNAEAAFEAEWKQVSAAVDGRRVSRGDTWMDRGTAGLPFLALGQGGLLWAETKRGMDAILAPGDSPWAPVPPAGTGYVSVSADWIVEVSATTSEATLSVRRRHADADRPPFRHRWRSFQLLPPLPFDGQAWGEQARAACDAGSDEACIAIAAQEGPEAYRAAVTSRCTNGSVMACGRRATLLSSEGPPFPEEMRGWLKTACLEHQGIYCFNWAEWELMYGDEGHAAWALRHRTGLPDTVVLQLRLCSGSYCGRLAPGWSSGNDWSAYLKSLESLPDGALHRDVVVAFGAGDQDAYDAALDALASGRKDGTPRRVERLVLSTPFRMRRPRGTPDQACPVRVTIDTDGVPTKILPEDCPEPLAKAAQELLRSARFEAPMDREGVQGWVIVSWDGVE